MGELRRKWVSGGGGEEGVEGEVKEGDN